MLGGRGDGGCGLVGCAQTGDKQGESVLSCCAGVYMSQAVDVDQQKGLAVARQQAVVAARPKFLSCRKGQEDQGCVLHGRQSLQAVFQCRLVY